ncbi:dienelactone hydrolase family protein [Leptobacterium sp. I13]|uniref:dienelactone hydrolase family protein n=1 Tax=Leptobacterium meishanense TaxID=3128904 RepID=UPI0030EC42C7
MKTNILLLTGIFLITVIACKEKPKTDVATVKIKGEEVTYATDSTTMNGYIAYDENKETKRPGVLVIHEWWGHNDYTRKRAEMLAELGYVAIAIDMYGDGKQANHPQDAAKFAASVMGNLPEATARFNAALEVLKNNPNVDTDKIAAIGYCLGGSIALTMANNGADLDAVAAFHSGVQLPVMPTDRLKANVFVGNGAEDPFIAPETVADFKRAMDSVQADYEYVAYEGAVHAYTNKEADSLGKKFNLPLAYQREADEKAWKSLKKLLETSFNN